MQFSNLPLHALGSARVLDRPIIGMMLGKFMPPHLGHLYLGDFARAACDRLYIVVGTMPGEPIDGEIRYRWMKELYPDCEVLHLNQVLPQDPSEHPQFWGVWQQALLDILPEPIDLVFASEEYGDPLAGILGASFVPVDIDRGIMPVSGTAVRNDPYGQWDYMPRPVRSWYCRRVSLVGAECTGKSTLAKQLASHFQTVMVPEYAVVRIVRDNCSQCITTRELAAFHAGQRASEEALSRSTNRALICDSDPLTIWLWAKELGLRPPAGLENDVNNRRYDLTFVPSPDGVPWEMTAHRVAERTRHHMHEMAIEELTRLNRPFMILEGSEEERFETAKAAVENLFVLNQYQEKCIDFISA